MYRLSQETTDDLHEVEYLYDLAFAPGRTALSSYRLRDGPPIAELSLVARDDLGILAGAIRYWPIVIGDDKHPALLLGPVAVHPIRQGEGLGRLLIDESLELAAKAGWARVVLIGDAPYYGRLGFSQATGLKFPPPTNPERVLVKPLITDAFDGVHGEVHSAPHNS